MQRTLQMHISFLEERIRQLSALIAKQPIQTEEERNRLQAEILIAEQALSYYQKGYELEQEIA